MKKTPLTYIFTTVLTLTLSSGGSALYLANQPTLTEAQTCVLNTAIALWTTGSTAIIGMLSSSSSSTPKKNDADVQS